MKIENLRQTQKEILSTYCDMTVGGKLVYATCSVLPPKRAAGGEFSQAKNQTGQVGSWKTK